MGSNPRQKRNAIKRCVLTPRLLGASDRQNRPSLHRALGSGWNLRNLSARGDERSEERTFPVLTVTQHSSDPYSGGGLRGVTEEVDLLFIPCRIFIRLLRRDAISVVTYKNKKKLVQNILLRRRRKNTRASCEFSLNRLK